ncbi:hypothetical protein ACS0TY_005714 [Phlomoides rotata]
MENTSGVLLTDDQHFLLYLIMGVYFGPDLKEGRPRKSALQRLVEGLPQYHATDLAGSCIKTSVIENVYYYILRKAEHPVIVPQPLVLQYIHGVLQLSLKAPTPYLQFDDLFPPKLHQRSQCDDQHFTISNIVLIKNPNIDYMNPGVIKRFKRLTGLEDFVLDTKLHVIVDDNLNPKVQWTSKLDDTMHLSVQCLETYHDGNRASNSSMPSSSSLCNEIQESDSSIVPQMTSVSSEDIDQGMIFLPSCPSMEEWGNLVATTNRGFALTGSAARGNVGPILGLMDIGESEDSYLFRVSLPGVRRDESNFSCEVESDGTVMIKGETVTGERRVERYSQVFEMRSQNLCPSGPFSISFKLPGPVDPQHFHGTFGTDGILEGIAMKARVVYKRRAHQTSFVPSHHQTPM